MLKQTTLAILLMSSLLVGCHQSYTDSEDLQHFSHWSYVGEQDPSHWGDLAKDFSLCKQGKNQSPVDLSDSLVTHSHTIKLQVTKTLVAIENNGHSIQVSPVNKDNILLINQKKFMLQQFHFHTPSEHTFKQKHFPLEGHFVFQADDGQLAVVAVFFVQGKSNPVLHQLEQQILNKGEKYSLTEAIDLAKLFPKNKKHFRLTGSLTTPPCTEGVNWIIMQQPITATSQQIIWLEQSMGHNNRPLQPLNARFIIQE